MNDKDQQDNEFILEIQMMEEMLRAKEREIDFKSKQIEEQEDEIHD